MSDLRGKLLMILAEYGRGYDTFAAADRILALLPKVTELRWDGTKLRSGEVCLGKVVYSQYVSEWGLYDMMGRSLGWRATEPEARAAVEAAVRKALGWEA